MAQSQNAVLTGLPRASMLTSIVCRLALVAPRFSPLRLVGQARRKRLIAAGAMPFTARAFNGVVIDALFFKAVARPHAPGLPVIVNHGYVEVKEMHEREVELLRRHGHDVLLYDLRAHGRSGGRFTTLGAWEQRDLTSLIDAAVERGLIGPRVITMGYSTGAATVVQHAPHDPRVVGVIAQAPFLSMTAAVRSFRRKLGAWICEEQLLRGFEQVAHAYGFDVKDSDTFSAIQQLQVPLLLVVGDCDSHLPPEEHFQPLAAAASPGLVKLLIVPGANHLSIYMRTWPELDRAIGDFCDTVK